MKLSNGLKEENIIVGNNFDKYHSSNPISQYLMSGFISSFDKMINKIAPTSIHEIGCGEGYWTIKLAQRGYQIKGSDFSEEIIKIAKENALSCNLDERIFSVESVYNVTAKDTGANLIICCEVLEHLTDPEKALKSLNKIASPYLLLSVPREPIWSFLNLCRGKYIASLGNTPGHIQRWSKKSFYSLVKKHFDILKIETPLPWTMILCKKKQ